MCELFGYNSDSLIKETELLSRFYAHSRIHPDGWGLYRSGGGSCCLHREALPAFKSKKNRQILENDHAASTLIAHIRYATVGEVRPGNVHPFQVMDPDGRLMTLAHCGNFPGKNELDPFIPLQSGSTDSERILLFINDALKKIRAGQRTPLTREQRIRTVEESLNLLSVHNRINMLMTDGELFYAHCNIRDRLFTAADSHTVYFSSSRIPCRRLHWQPLPCGQLFVYEQNRLCYRSPAHGSVFEPAKIPVRNTALI
ncbi:MAG: class II glutamine amidotransferase [Bacilli bacterium]|jgi:predicted glutamine amidotransferase